MIRKPQPQFIAEATHSLVHDPFTVPFGRAVILYNALRKMCVVVQHDLDKGDAGALPLHPSGVGWVSGI